MELKLLRRHLTVVTWLEGNLAEQQPLIPEVETTLDAAGGSIPEGNGDKVSPFPQVLRRWPEVDGVSLPVWSWPEETRDLSEHAHSTAQHVVAVNLREGKHSLS